MDSKTEENCCENNQETLILSINNFIRQKYAKIDQPFLITDASSLNCRQLNILSTCLASIGFKLSIKDNKILVTVSPKQIETSNLRHITQECRRDLSMFMRENPISNKEREILCPIILKSQLKAIRLERQRTATGRLMGAVPHVPPLANCNQESHLLECILDLENLDRVTIIRGRPGLGRSHLLLKDLLEYHSANAKKCRILCAEPNRLTAHSRAEFLASERSEQVGQTIGYQIRLESKVSPRTILTFCTYGVLLRTLYADIGVLSGTTHVILDDLDEDMLNAKTHDKFSCFDKTYLCNMALVLSTLPECIRKFTHLKFILIANSTSNGPLTLTNTLALSKPQIVNVKIPQQLIKVVHLDQIISWLQFWNPEMGQTDSVFAKDKSRADILGRLLSSQIGPKGFDDLETSHVGYNNNAALSHIDRLLEKIWCQLSLASNDLQTVGRDELIRSANSLLQCILSGWCSLDHQHLTLGVTSLMTYAVTGFEGLAESLLSHGANPFIRTAFPIHLLKSNAYFKEHFPGILKDLSGSHIGCNAYDLARIFNHQKCAQIIKIHMTINYQTHLIENYEASYLRFKIIFPNPVHRFSLMLFEKLDQKLISDNERSWVSYVIGRQLKNIPDTAFDLQLLICLVDKINVTLPPGNILVFLPSYESLINLRDALLTNSSQSNFLVYLLHQRMVVSDLRMAFQSQEPNKRKVILTTNFLETSFAMKNIAYVIDTGLNFDKLRNIFTGVVGPCYRWIHSRNADFRKNKITLGTKGICFRLYSSPRSELLDYFLSKESFPNGEIDIASVSLLSRYLAPPGKPADHFIRIANFPLTNESIYSNFLNFRMADIVNDNYELTELGYHICDLPIKPCYAKMVLISVALKCLDPILTIACILNQTEPFIHPVPQFNGKDMNEICKKFSADTLSDHMTLLRAFQLWQKARTDGWTENFCQKNFISSSAFEIITLIRTQLLGQLRASGFVKARGMGDIRDLNINSDNWAVVKASIVAGMYPNLAKFDQNSGQFRPVFGCYKNETRIHPQSVLCPEFGFTFKQDSNSSAYSIIERSLSPLKLTTEWLIYDHLTSIESTTSQINMLKCCTLVSPICVALMAGPIRSSQLREFKQSHQLETEMEFEHVNPSLQDHAAVCNSDLANLFLSNILDIVKTSASHLNPGRLDVETRFHKHINFHGDVIDCQLLTHLRQKWHSLFLRRLRNPTKPSTASDEANLKVLVSLLTQEEQILGLKQPFGIGMRPKPMLAESCNPDQNSSMYKSFQNECPVLNPSTRHQKETALSRVQLANSLIRRKLSQSTITLDYPNLQLPEIVNLNYEKRVVQQPVVPNCLATKQMVDRVMSLTLAASHQHRQMEFLRNHESLYTTPEDSMLCDTGIEYNALTRLLPSQNFSSNNIGCSTRLETIGAINSGLEDANEAASYDALDRQTSLILKSCLQ